MGFKGPQIKMIWSLLDFWVGNHSKVLKQDVIIIGVGHNKGKMEVGLRGMSRQKPKTDLCLCMEYDSISEVGGKLAVTFFNLLPTTCEEIEAKKGHGAYSTAYS